MRSRPATRRSMSGPPKRKCHSKGFLTISSQGPIQGVRYGESNTVTGHGSVFDPNGQRVPISVVSMRNNVRERFGIYSITSSARASSDAGTVIPSAFAVLTLITSSNLVGCRTGRSAGFSPLRMRPVDTGLTRGVLPAGAITHEATRRGRLAISKASRKRLEQRQFRNATVTDVEKGITQNEKRIGVLLPEIVESPLDLFFCAGVDESDSRPERTSSLPCFVHLQLRIGVLRVHERRKTVCIRSELAE